MFRASLGGRDAAHGVYRHALVRVMMPLFAPVSTGRGWSDLALALGAVLMGWSAAPTLAQRFEWTLALLDRALPRRRRTGRTFQGFVKASAKRRRCIVAAMLAQLRERTRAVAGRGWFFGEFVPIAADGSKFDAPRTISNEALGLAGKDKCGPQMMTLLLIHLGCMLPWAWKVGNAPDAERTLLRRLLGTLPHNTLLVADAGFTGFDLLSELRRRGVHFLIRVGRGARLLKELGYYAHEGKSTVYLWPDQLRARRPLVLRLIEINGVFLITSVTDPRRLSKAAAAELYRRRWGVEVTFRTLKQTLARRKVRSAAAGNARAELDWVIVGLWVLGLIGGEALRGTGAGPRRLSYAAALSAVRHAAQTNLPTRRLRGRLRRALIDQYRRRSSKRAYRWPHKKTQSAPGRPRITRATRSQVRLAKALPRSTQRP
jgi:hypothetical protein